MHRDWTRGEEARLVEMRRAGTKVILCASRLGRSTESVKRKLWRLGVVVEPFKRMRRRHGELMRKAKPLLLQGFGAAEVAERLGVCKSAVIHARQRLGLPGPTRSEIARRAGATRILFRRARSAS